MQPLKHGGLIFILILGPLGRDDGLDGFVS